MRQHLVMADSRNRSAGRSVDSNAGTLIVVGFTGNPQQISEAILSSGHVENVSVKRSGTQLELKLSISHPPVTVERLLELVYLLPDYDVNIQGRQMTPVPTLVLALTPPPARRGGFSRRKSRREPVERILSRTEPQDPVPAPYIRTTAAGVAIPTHQSTGIIAPERGREEYRQPVAIIVHSKRLGRAVAQLTAGGLALTASVIGPLTRSSIAFSRRRKVQIVALARRTLFRVVSATFVIVPRISNVIAMFGNGIFGTGADDDPKTGPSESPPSERNRNRRN